MLIEMTDRVRTVLGLASKDAQRRAHDEVSAEHVLLALLEHGESVATAVLERLNVDQEVLTHALEQRLSDPAIDARQPNWSPEELAVPLLSAAADEARSLHHFYVGTEHLLIAITRPGFAQTAELLAAHGVTPTDALGTTAYLLGSQTG